MLNRLDELAKLLVENGTALLRTPSWIVTDVRAKPPVRAFYP
jgi:hypothetical protein